MWVSRRNGGGHSRQLLGQPRACWRCFRWSPCSRISCSKAETGTPTVSVVCQGCANVVDTIALVRRQLWLVEGFWMSRDEPDRVKTQSLT